MLSCSLFCLVLCLSANIVFCYQVYVYPQSGCRGTPQIFSLENAACDGINDFFQIGTCTANSQSITVKSYSDTQCKTTPRATITAKINTCTLDVIKYACIQGQVPTGGGGGGGETTTTTKPPTTAGTTTSTPTSTSSDPTSDPNPTITPSSSSSSTSTNVNQTDINAATSTPIADNVTLTLTLVIFLVVTILAW